MPIPTKICKNDSNGSTSTETNEL